MAHINRLISASLLVNKWHIVLDNLNIHKSESLVNFIASYDGIGLNSLSEKTHENLKSLTFPIFKAH